MKTIFEGTVNGVTYNNVNEYNKAITEALRNGKVEASSCTKTIEDEPENKSITPVFYGEVNDTPFYSVEEYNKAIQKAIENGTLSYAWTETRTNDIENPEDDMVDIDWFPGMDKDDYYMDSVGSGEEGKVVIDDWRKYLAESLKTFMNDLLPEMEDDELDEYYNDLKDVLNQVYKDGVNTEKVFDNTKNIINDIIELLNKLGGTPTDDNVTISTDELMNKMSLLENCKQLNDLFKDYYNEIDKIVKDEIDKRKNDDGPLNPPLTEQDNTKEETHEDELRNGIRKLLDELFSK